METTSGSTFTPVVVTTTTQSSSSFSKSNIIIIILLMILISLLFKVDITNMFKEGLSKANEFVEVFIKKLGFTIGTVTNITSTAAIENPKVNAGIIEDHISISGDGNAISTGSLDTVLNGNYEKKSNPDPTPAESSIQKPISSNKGSWCLVGEYQGTRGCIDVNDTDMCMSGQLFPSQKMCLNPTMATTV